MTPAPNPRVDSVGVETVPTKDLIPNPHNPRILFDKIPHETLKESVKKVGILVPLTVYWGSSEKSYVILDGQRRWLCAQELGLPEVPVNVVREPDAVQNIVTMFQIHGLREDWQLMPTALKIEVLMNKLREKSDKKLAELTGLPQAQVVRCRKLLSYPRKYQDLMLNPEPAQRPPADFFIELYAIRTNPFVNSLSWFSKDQFTRRMLKKYTNRKGIKNVTDFRKMQQFIRNAVKAGKGGAISKRLRDFAKDDSVQLDHLLVPEADVSASARKLIARLAKLEKDIKGVNVEAFFGEKKLWDVMEKLLKLIHSKLLAADRRVRL